jgi:multidrug efflux pump subunit AcrB
VKKIDPHCGSGLGIRLEQPTIWRRNRIATITIKATVTGATQPATVVTALAEKVETFKKTLPAGYSVEVGGSVEESAKSQGPIAQVAPLMLFIMAALLMIQLQISNAPLGFVALLGVLALIGILIRNSVILVVQIEELRACGASPWKAVVEATEHRMRPIMLTAAAATLALIPISREIFWGPMAYAMMGGIIVGTVLTLLFLPALYVTWFRIRPDVEQH